MVNDTNPKHSDTYRKASDTHSQEDERCSSVITHTSVHAQRILHAPDNCLSTLERLMQRTTDLHSSLPHLSDTPHRIAKRSVGSSASACQKWNINDSIFSEEIVLSLSVYSLPASVLGIASPPLLGYDITWSTVAYLLIVVAAVAAGVWGYRKLAQRNRQLEQLVEQRTSRVQLQARQLARYNAELIRSNKVLQQTVDEKSKVLGVAAHDLKNSVFGIRALSEVMLEEDMGNEAASRRLLLIHNSAQQAMTLINNLLSSAASSVHGELEKEIVNVNTMADLVAHSFAEQSKRKGQRIACTVPPDSLFVEGDEDRLREALNNLVSNAVKYAPLDSEITLCVSATDSEVRISVSDEGPGLSLCEQEGLFTPFKRLSPEPTGNEGSSGLGLYIVKQIMKRHEGRVEVASEECKGSTFTLVLSRAQPDDKQLEQDTETISPGVDASALSEDTESGTVWA